MKKFTFCVTLALAGLMTGCVDKNELVDADKVPEWLGGSIYQELKTPSLLTGTFETYLRLVDDLAYDTTLNRTGSKTLFPANDEAFDRFFKSNAWGVKNYDELTTAQKQQLLYSSMLDNALLIGMLSNVSDPQSVSKISKGRAMKHQTDLQTTATVQYMKAEDMPKNNAYWDEHRQKGGIYVVSDATRPMMVHFTREHMLTNNITTLGDDSDFAILTGTPYENGMAYIFGNRIVNSDITCLNGYVHQVDNVIVPPGNMSQVLRNDEQTKYFSRILDYFSAPYENPTVTDAYNAWALENGLEPVDMIYEIKYFNTKKGAAVDKYPDGVSSIRASESLEWNPGWNQYSPNTATESAISDVGAMFIPVDKAVEDFFLNGGDGAYLIDLYGRYKNEENTREHLLENLDSLFVSNKLILTKFMRNLMKQSFVETVPSKFETIQNDAKDYMGVTTDILTKRADGKYDILMANNGVIYKMDEMIAPDEYQSVMAPSSVYPDMRIMNWAVQDDSELGVSFHYYLMAMKSNYAFFIPDDEAFSRYYVDPIYLKRDTPRALKFTWEGDTTYNEAGDMAVKNVGIRCRGYEYDPETNTVGAVLKSGATVPVTEWSTLFRDILDYHTVVLGEGEQIGANNYYKTKHGGEIRITGNNTGAQVMSGQQIDNGVEPSVITKVYDEKNGQAFRINHVIESPRNSVYTTLQNYDCFQEFYDVCAGFSSAPELMKWAGISDSVNVFGITEQDSYIIFTADRGSGSNKVEQSCLDANVKMFNTYNYTLYAPNNAAMERAYAAGLPRWKDIQDIYEEWAVSDDEDGQAAAKAEAKQMINKLRDFTHYHFQSSSIYVDNTVESGRFNSLCTNDLGLAIEMNVSGGGGKLNVEDATGTVVTIDAADSSKHLNLMARDYWFDNKRTVATSIYTSSFCAVHEIDKALNCGTLGLTW